MSNLPMRTADPHNFGKRVSKVTEGGVSYFEKPRPVFWEWLFFGSDSHLRSVLAGTDIEEAVFGLDVVFDPTTGKGRSREVPRAALEPQMHYRYGMLIAYCFVLGILDLHDGNLIPTEGRIQVIDAEIVLARLHLPDETLLLPFKDVPFADSGLKLLFKSQAELAAQNAKALISGFVDALTQLEVAGPELAEAISHELAARPPIPIRVILRNTIRYYERDQTNFEIPLMPDELAQLERGDIPYFFKFLGDNNLYQYVSARGEHEVVEVPSGFRGAVNRVGHHPAALVASSRIRQELFPAGILLLARKLVPSSFVGELSVGHSQLRLTDTEIQVVGLWGSYSTNRIRVM